VAVPDYDFSRLNSRSFEQLVQALSVSTLGPGVVVFGDGPDGGREATFRGKVGFPSKAEQWDGYIVLQAKFLQRPTGTAKDVQWLEKQLQQEFQKYSDPSRKLERPEYFIVATNVLLSGMRSRAKHSGGRHVGKPNAIMLGGIDRITRLLEQGGFKGFSVWHAGQLRTFLDRDSEVRTSYSAWVLPGDVLSQLLDNIRGDSPAFPEVISRFLQHELLEQRSTRLQDAGHSSSNITYLEDVFVDLPVFDPHSANPNPRQDTGADAEQRPKLLDWVLQRAAQKLDPTTLSTSTRNGSSTLRPERCLLLGGPGQGKSTGMQFLAQLFRVRALNTLRHARFPAEVRQVIAATEKRAAVQNLGRTVPYRFPVRVSLPIYADEALRSGQESSLLTYIANHVSAVADSTVSREDLRKWLKTAPWILMLDGLDEVPESANRAGVIKAIAGFWIEVGILNADVMMIVTTREQGYNKELDPATYQELKLVSLNTTEAVFYATELAKACLADRTQRARVLERINQAAENATTASLMISPLQVAIMLALIDQRGEAPTDRWGLFNGYYQVITARERAKPGDISSVLKSHALAIDEIHQDVGLLLQITSEQPGQANAFLSNERFNQIVSIHLKQVGYTDQELQTLVERITKAAKNRLIFLVSRVDGQIGFDVRSLQEFMAASKIMSGQQELVQARLRQIAVPSHWRHVFQIAASKCFSVPDTTQFRDTILVICDELNGAGGQEVGAVSRAGAYLAVQLLSDGVAVSAPKYRNLLLERALSGLDLGPEFVTREFANTCSELKTVTSARLFSTLSGGVVGRIARLAAWRLLWLLHERRVEWSEQIIRTHWRPTHEDAVDAVLQALVLPGKGELPSIVVEFLGQLSPTAIYDALNKTYHSNYLARQQANERTDSLGLVLNFRQASRQLEIGIGDTKSAADITMNVIGFGHPLSNRPPKQFTGSEWCFLSDVHDFHAAPTTGKLATILRKLNSGELLSAVESIAGNNFPWPLYSIIRSLSDVFTPELAAAEIEAGNFGSVDDWLAAEQRWLGQGITISDLMVWRTGRCFDARIATVGAPVPQTISISSPRRPTKLSFQELARLTDSLRGTPLHASAAWMLSDVLELDGDSEASIGEKIKTLMATARSSKIWLNGRIIDLLSPAEFTDQQLIEDLAALGREGRVYASEEPEQHKGYTALCEAYRTHPDFRGLLYFVLVGVATGQVGPPLDVISQLSKDNLVELDSDPPAVRQAVRCLGLLHPKIAREVDSGDGLFAEGSSRFSLVTRMFFERLRRAKLLNIPVLLRELKNHHVEPGTYFLLVNMLTELFQSPPSHLADETDWVRSGFSEELLPVLKDMRAEWRRSTQ
jgi:hypothetical protein